MAEKSLGKEAQEFSEQNRSDPLVKGDRCILFLPHYSNIVQYVSIGSLSVKLIVSYLKQTTIELGI